MKLVRFRCKPYTRFHLGQNSLEDSGDLIHSDTLFSAMVNCYRMLYPDSVSEFIEAFNSGAIRLSSAFPCLQHSNENKYIYFLPFPLLYQSEAPEGYRVFKSIRYISVDLWNVPESAQTLARQLDPLSHRQSYRKLGGEFLMSMEEAHAFELNDDSLPPNTTWSDIKLLKQVMYPKVKVHHSDQIGVFYHTAAIQISPITLQKLNKQVLSLPVHYYCLLDHDADRFPTAKLHACMRLMGDQGIGGERSSGNGILEDVDFCDAHQEGFPHPNADQKSACLSLFVPQNQNEFEAVEHYQLLLRGGGSLGKASLARRKETGKKVDDLQHRGQVRMISEGAIFSRPLHGKLVDLAPKDENGNLIYQHSIYRNGLAFTLPFPYEH